MATERCRHHGQHALAYLVVVLTSDSPRSPPRQALASQRDCSWRVHDNQCKPKKIISLRAANTTTGRKAARTVAGLASAPGVSRG